jgi:flagellar motor switch protein FliG
VSAGVTPATVRGALRNEPPHTAAAVISALPAATAAAVLDLYPPEERAGIIRRMQRPRSPFIPDLEQVLADA